MSNGVDFYQKLMTLAPGDLDYAGLDQGPEGTGKRHWAAIDNVKLNGKSVLDLGCGTGLLLKTLDSQGIRPSWYLGTDLLAEREDMVRSRLAETRVEGSFLQLDLNEHRWLKLPVGRFDSVLALGLMGPEPFHTYASLRRLIENMRLVGDHGVVTIPMMRPGFLGCEYQAHFDYRDVFDFLPTLPKYTKITLAKNTEKEMFIWW